MGTVATALAPVIEAPVRAVRDLIGTTIPADTTSPDPLTTARTDDDAEALAPLGAIGTYALGVAPTAATGSQELGRNAPSRRHARDTTGLAPTLSAHPSRRLRLNDAGDAAPVMRGPQAGAAGPRTPWGVGGFAPQAPVPPGVWGALPPMDEADETRSAPLRVPDVPPLEVMLVTSRATRHVDAPPLKGVLVVKAPAQVDIRVPADVVVVVDVSGSMQGQKLETLKRILNWMATDAGLGPDDRVAIITFDDTARVDMPLRFMTAEGKEQLRRVSDALAVRGGTTIAAGTRKAADLLAARRYVNASASVILLSDGQDDRARQQCSVSMHGLVKLSTMRTIGVGDDHDPVMLQALARMGSGEFAYAADSSSMASALGAAVAAAASTVASRLANLHVSAIIADTTAAENGDASATRELLLLEKTELGTLCAGETRYYTFECPTSSSAYSAESLARVSFQPPFDLGNPDLHEHISPTSPAHPGGAAADALPAVPVDRTLIQPVPVSMLPTETRNPLRLEAHVEYQRPGSGPMSVCSVVTHLQEGDGALAERDALVLIEQHQLREATAEVIERASELAARARLDEARDALDSLTERIRASIAADTPMATVLLADIQWVRNNCAMVMRPSSGALAYMMSSGARHRSMRATFGTPAPVGPGAPPTSNGVDGGADGLYATPSILMATQSAMHATQSMDDDDNGMADVIRARLAPALQPLAE